METKHLTGECGITEAHSDEDHEQVVAVLVVRHPDAENNITVDAPEGVRVVTISVDYGSGYDGQPRDEDEADYADEQADDLVEQASQLPEGNPIRAQVEAIVRELRSDAREARRR